MAHASYYYDKSHCIASNVDLEEIGYTVVLLIFIAHCYVEDETCPLKVWHKHIFRYYSPMSILNMALVKIMELHDYKLRMPEEELKKRYAALRGHKHHVRADAKTCGGDLRGRRQVNEGYPRRERQQPAPVAEDAT